MQEFERHGIIREVTGYGDKAGDMRCPALGVSLHAPTLMLRERHLMDLSLTSQHLEKITSKEPPEVLAKGLLALRVGVESGGCHGYQYIMEIVEERGTDD